MIKISACTIARNEEKNIQTWLDNVYSFADEIVVVDTGSVDNTENIVKKSDAKLEHFTWCNDFSAAKNYAIDCCSGDWIVMLDADEYFTKKSQKKIRQIIERYHKDEIVAGIITPLTNIDVNCDNKVMSRAVQMRIFRREKDLRFQGKVHETLANLRLGGNNRDYILVRELEIIHTGYSFINIEEKHRRNLAIILAEIKAQGEESPRHFNYLQDCYMGLKDYEKSIHYGRLALKHRHESGLVGHEDKVIGQLLDALYVTNSPTYVDEVEDILREFPDVPNIWVHKGRRLLQQGELNLAQEAFQRAVNLHEKSKGNENVKYSNFDAMLPEIQSALTYINFHKPYYEYMQNGEYIKAAVIAALSLRNLYGIIEKKEIIDEAAYIFPNYMKHKFGNHFTSIIIVNYDLLLYTRMLIESIRMNTPTGSYEIIVVDNGSTDGSVDYLRQEKDVKLIANRENAGFPKASNQGMAAAIGDEILLLNNDTIVTPRWLENLRCALYSSKEIGAVGPVTNCCSNLQEITITYENKLDSVNMARMYTFADKYNISDSRKWHKWYKLVGFCFLLKRQIYEKIGGLDESFSPGHYEDDDYSLRIKRAGYELLLCEDTFIHHFGSVSFKQESIAKKGGYYNCIKRSLTKFMHKWRLTEKDYDIYWSYLFNVLFSKEKSRIIEYSCGCRLDLYIIARQNPSAEIYGTVKNKQDLLMMSSFPMYHVKDLLEFTEILDGQYDCIIVSEDYDELTDKSTFIKALESHITADGYIVLREKQS